MTLTAQALAGLLADDRRLRVVGAVALGAATPADVAAATGLPARDVTALLHRLTAAGVLTAEPLAVAYDALRALARTDAGDPGPLAPFVVGDRLRSLPAAPARRRAVLAHVAERALPPDRDHTEAEVNALLGAWCDGGEVDRAALRRYLVEEGLVSRGGGVYRRGRDTVPPGLGERRVRALGLS